MFKSRVRSISTGSTSDVKLELDEESKYDVQRREKSFIIPVYKTNLVIEIIQDGYKIKVTVEIMKRRYKERLFFYFDSYESFQDCLHTIKKSSKYEQKDSIYNFTDDGYVVINPDSVEFIKNRKRILVEGVGIDIFNKIITF